MLYFSTRTCIYNTLRRLANKREITLRVVMEMEGNKEFMHLEEFYSMGCNPMLGQLRARMGDGDGLAVYVQAQIYEALREASKKRKIEESDEK